MKQKLVSFLDIIDSEVNRLRVYLVTFLEKITFTFQLSAFVFIFRLQSFLDSFWWFGFEMIQKSEITK